MNTTHSSTITLGLFLLLSLACNTQKTIVTIKGGKAVYIEAYNGHKKILKDSLTTNPITGVSISRKVAYRFSDSLYVKIKFRDGGEWAEKTKIAESDYIYIEVENIGFKTYGINRKISYR